MGEITRFVVKTKNIMKSKFYIKWYNSETPEEYDTKIDSDRVESITKEEFDEEKVPVKNAAGQHKKGRSSVNTRNAGRRSTSRRASTSRRTSRNVSSAQAFFMSRSRRLAAMERRHREIINEL